MCPPDISFILERAGAEVQQEANFVAGCLEVIEDLRLFRAAEPRQRLDFDDDRLKADEVNPVGRVEFLSLVENGKFYFTPGRRAAKCEFLRHRLLINGFQKA